MSSSLMSGDTATLVTSLYDIGRDRWKKYEREMNTYLKYFEQVLALDIPMAIFIDESLAAFVKENRKTKLDKTKIYQRSLGELVFSKYASDISEVLCSDNFLTKNEMLKHPEAFSKEYIIITNNKTELVREVAEENPFKTTHFVWLDAGYGHGNDIFPENKQWEPKNLFAPKMEGKITYIVLKDIRKYLDENDMLNLHKRDVDPVIIGGFFGGSADTVIEFAKLFKEEFLVGLRNSVVDDDQGTTLRTYLKHPDMFNLVIGDWYDVFKLFH